MSLTVLYIASYEFLDVACLVRLGLEEFVQAHVRREEPNCYRFSLLFLIFSRCPFLRFRDHGKILSTEAMSLGSGEPHLSVWLPLLITYRFRWMMLTVRVITSRQIRTRMLIASPFFSLKSLIAFDVSNYNALHIIGQAIYKNYPKFFGCSNL